MGHLDLDLALNVLRFYQIYSVGLKVYSIENRNNSLIHCLFPFSLFSEYLRRPAAMDM